MDILEIEIVNWEKYNPRKDLKSTTWMRLQNSIFEDPQFYDFSHEEICFWIYLMCLASKKQSPTVHVHVTHALRIGRFKSDTIFGTIEKLQRLQCVRKRDVHVTSTLHPVALRTNEHNEHTYLQEPTGLQDQIGQAWSIWNDTLAAFKIPKSRIAPPQENSIARAIKTIGFENVLLALEGLRYERPGRDFKPQEHLSLDRVLHRDKSGTSRWERFKNMALAAKSEQETTRSQMTEEEMEIQAFGRKVSL